MTTNTATEDDILATQKNEKDYHFIIPIKDTVRQFINFDYKLLYSWSMTTEKL